MPILIKNYRWTQTDDHIRLHVPLPAANRRQPLDIFIQPDFIKISAPPHLCEVYLLRDIDATLAARDATSTTRLHENEVRLQLRKSQPGCAWPTLERSVARADTVAVKTQCVSGAHELAAVEDQRRARLAHDIRQAEIQREIGRESAIRKEVEELRRNACGREMAAVKVLKEGEQQEKAAEVSLKGSSKTVAIAAKPAAQPAALPPRPPAVVLPAVRRAASIAVDFSERRFPTPMRESQAPLEQEWLVRQNEARRAVGFVEEDLRAEERNVDWLKAKGDDFYAKRNYLGAISAYTTAIRMSPKCHDLYVNRASCQYVLKNYNRCISDASAALDLLVPACPSNLKARAQCLVKRGAALCKLGHLRQGRDELRAALYLVPDDKDLRCDLQTVELELEKQLEEEE